VRARSTEKGKNDNKNKHSGEGGRIEGCRVEYHAMECQRSVPNENPPPVFCSTSVLRNKEEINTNERVLSCRQLQIYLVSLREMFHVSCACMYVYLHPSFQPTNLNLLSQTPKKGGSCFH